MVMVYSSVFEGDWGARSFGLSNVPCLSDLPCAHFFFFFFFFFFFLIREFNLTKAYMYLVCRYLTFTIVCHKDFPSALIRVDTRKDASFCHCIKF